MSAVSSVKKGAERPPSNLNLRHNDNAFHVLASLLVEFFQSRLVVEHSNNGNNKKYITISLADKKQLQRILPKTATWDFVDAVGYRLEMTPVVPVTPIHFLTINCQEFCLDKEETMENPILAIYEIVKTKTSTVVNIDVLSDIPFNNKTSALLSSTNVEDDSSGSTGDADYRAAIRQASHDNDDTIEDNSDGYVHTNFIGSNSSDRSSSTTGSGIKVASSQDIADEIMQQEVMTSKCTDTNNNNNLTTTTAAALSDTDSLPTEFDDDDYDEFVPTPDDHQFDQREKLADREVALPNEDEENAVYIDNTDNEQLTQVVILQSEQVDKDVTCLINEHGETDTDAKKTVIDCDKMTEQLYVVGTVEDEGEEIEVLPTLTNTFDDETQSSAHETENKFEPSSVMNAEIKKCYQETEMAPAGISDIAVAVETTTIDISNRSIPTVTGVDINEETTKSLVADNIIPNQIPDMVSVHDVLKEASTEMNKDAGSMTNNRDCNIVQLEENKPMQYLDEKGDVRALCQISNDDKLDSEDPDLDSPKTTCTTDTNSVALRMQGVAGTFFSELRNTIDEKVEEFEYALVNAIVSKRIPRPTKNYRNDPEVQVGRETIDIDGDRSEQSKYEDIIREKIPVVDPSVSSSKVAKQRCRTADTRMEEATRNDSDTLTDADLSNEGRNIDEKDEEDHNFGKPISPTSYSVQSGFSSLLAGFAAGFTPSIKGSDARSVQSKANISTFPSDESTSKEKDVSVIDFSVYESMEVTDNGAKQQLLLELKEACTLMKQSITPETTRFWSDHIQNLRTRLNALRKNNMETLDQPFAKRPTTIDEREAPKYHVRALRTQKRENFDGSVPEEQKAIDEQESHKYNVEETLPASLSDVQSTAVMSAILSTRGIPVVPAISSFSNNLNDQNKNKFQEQPIVDTSFVDKESQTENEFVNLDQKALPQPIAQPEIELSESRKRFETSPSDEMYTQPHDSNPQQTIDNDDRYYEYPLVDVVAPADLPGGYHFEAEIEGQRFLATVPPGGVQQGETFTCFMKELDSVAIDIPVGEWKDGLCNMSELGWCHPVLWNALFCPLIALGQIQTRIDLDFLGRPKFGELPYTNRFMMFLVIASWAGTNAALFAACNLKWSRGLELSVADGCAFALVNVAMFGFVVFVAQSTRSSVREKFMIRERCCYDLEDVCFAALCLPCAVGQMQRHTANYDDYEAVCCSKTGLPNGVRVSQEPAKVKEVTLENDDGYMA